MRVPEAKERLKIYANGAAIFFSIILGPILSTPGYVLFLTAVIIFIISLGMTR